MRSRTARTEPMASCCICLEEMAHTIVCADNHATCEECFETYLINKTTDLGQTSMLAAKAEAAALAGDEGRLAELGGGCFCPLNGLGGCKAAGPFEDREIAKHVSSDAFEKHVQGKALLPAARKVQEVTGMQSITEHTSVPRQLDRYPAFARSGR